MSMDHAKKFHEMLESDPGLRAKVRKARNGALAEVREIGKEHGFRFTNKELHSVLKRKWKGRVSIGKSLDDKDDPSTCFMLSERPGE